MAKVQSFETEFNGTTTPLGWTQFTGGSATFTYDSTGATVNYPATTSASTDGDIKTTTTYSLIDSYAMVNILAIPASSAVNAQGVFRLQITSTDVIGFQFTGGNIRAYQIIASSLSVLATATWSATTHAFVRIRESNGTTYWEYSSTGIEWTLMWSALNPITETALTVVFVGFDTGVDASPGTFKWRAFNKPTGLNNNYQAVKVGDGMSVSERIR